MLNILLNDDYYRRWTELKLGRSNYAAYIELENEMYERYGVYRFNSYPAFKNWKSNYIRQLRKCKKGNDK